MPITYHWLDKETFDPLFKQHRSAMFADHVNFDINAMHNDEEIRTSHNTYKNHLIFMAAVAYDSDTLVGWSRSDQQDDVTLYMRNSAVYPAYRRQGVYNTLLHMTLDKAKEAGFRAVTSKHIMTNNAVIIPKLKAGFTISGVEVSPQHGTFVKLTYFINQGALAAQRWRCGEEKLPTHLQQFVS